MPSTLPSRLSCLSTLKHKRITSNHWLTSVRLILFELWMICCDIYQPFTKRIVFWLTSGIHIRLGMCCLSRLAPRWGTHCWRSNAWGLEPCTTIICLWVDLNRPCEAVKRNWCEQFLFRCYQPTNSGSLSHNLCLPSAAYKSNRGWSTVLSSVANYGWCSFSSHRQRTKSSICTHLYGFLLENSEHHVSHFVFDV